MSHERYFDNAATTPVDPRVLREMLPFFEDAYGNANSLHEPGRRALDAVERARQRVAALVGADYPSQIVFTSGATEANNWVLQRSGSVACSPFEHSSVWETTRALGGEILSNDGYVLHSPEKPVETTAVMLVNNETGTLISPPPAGNILRDLTQAVGKIPTQGEEGYANTFSSHKFYGPKGIGALYLTQGSYEPLLYGGEQEQGQRAGTLNVPAIVGMGCAAAIAADEMNENRVKVEELRALALDELTKLSDVKLNGGDKTSPYIVSLSFLGVEGETLVVEADRAGYSISSGAACSSRSTEPSHVLTALALPPAWLRGTIRISFGVQNTKESTADLARVLRTSVEKLRTMQ